MDDLKVFKDLITPNSEIKDVHVNEVETNEDGTVNLELTDHEKDDSGEIQKQTNDVEKNFQFDEDETKFGIEQLGTLLSAFLQDDSGRNVVDAIVQNTKWQRNICRALERIGEQLACKSEPKS